MSKHTHSHLPAGCASPIVEERCTAPATPPPAPMPLEFLEEGEATPMAVTASPIAATAAAVKNSPAGRRCKICRQVGHNVKTCPQTKKIKFCPACSLKLHCCKCSYFKGSNAVQNYAAGAARATLSKRMLPPTEPMRRSNKKRCRPVSLPTARPACPPSPPSVTHATTFMRPVVPFAVTQQQMPPFAVTQQHMIPFAVTQQQMAAAARFTSSLASANLTMNSLLKDLNAKPAFVQSKTAPSATLPPVSSVCPPLLRPVTTTPPAPEDSLVDSVYALLSLHRSGAYKTQAAC
jgi:hypothetical protein